MAIAFTVLAFLEVSLPLKEKQLLIVTIVFIFGTTILTSTLLKMPVYSFPILFMLGTIAFGPIVYLLVLLYGEYGLHPSWKVNDYDMLLVCTSHYMLAFSIFFVGALFGRRKRFADVRVNALGKLNWSSLRLVGYLLFAYSILAIIVSFVNGQGIAVMIQGNYGDFAELARTNEVSVWTLTAFNWFLPWSVLILLVTASNKKQFNIRILLYMLPAVLILFLIGDRAAPFYLMGVTLGIGYLLGFVPKRIKPIKLGVMAVAALLLIPLVRTTRSVPVGNWNLDMVDEMMRVTDERVETNLVVDALTEMSFQAQCLPGTLLLVPEQESFRYGYDFIKAIYYAIPFSGKIYSSDKLGLSGRKPGIHSKPTAWFTYHYSRYGAAGIGFSQIAEAYLHFGIAGIFVLYYLLGYWLSRLWTYFEYSPALRQDHLLIFLFMFLTIMIWIRNDSGSIFRNLMYALIFIKFFPFVFRFMIGVFSQMKDKLEVA